MRAVGYKRREESGWIKWGRELLDLIFPPAAKCAGCGRVLAPGEELLCRGCREAISLLTEPTCGRCGRPLTHPGLCAHCRKEEWAFVRAWPAAIYREPLREILHSFKYGRETRLAPFLAGLVVARLKAASGVPATPLVVPVPLDPGRLSERGFNQAELLAREVAHAFGWPLAIGLLRRTRPTRPQAELAAEERRENVAHVFQARTEAAGKVIVLIDDIFTTGATADSASAALLAAGARKVYVATVAVASSHPHPHQRGADGILAEPAV
ncbi:MAG: hypothetical protein PWP58_1540 [Bacillota bacterium]|jgi:ComF family protein|nr:hypothetical protein [Bacillota bacterium]